MAPVSSEKLPVENKSTSVHLQSRPLNAETPMGALTETVTPVSLFYVRNHFDTPQIDGEKWRLTVDGSVKRRLQFSLKEIQDLPKRIETVTMECAGNGRIGMIPRPEGVPWAYGATGTAKFIGTPLGRLLEQANPLPEACEALFVGADDGQVEPGRVESFARSLPLDVARNSDALLVWAMNDEPLLPEHGFPLRLVVPGWYGMASVKWLVRISIIPNLFEGYFQKQYAYVGGQGSSESTPVSLMRVRAVIGRPPDGMEVRSWPVEVAGTAWSGYGPISKVEVSVDNGQSWAEAEVGKTPSRYAAAPWRFVWDSTTPGTHVIMVRATDEKRNIQPPYPVWNTRGYGNNAFHSVRIVVK